MIFHNGTKNFIKSQLNLINPQRLICKTATTGKAPKALPGFCRIVSTGSASTLWQPCLPKIGRGIFAVFTQVWIIQKCEFIIDCVLLTSSINFLMTSAVIFPASAFLGFLTSEPRSSAASRCLSGHIGAKKENTVYWGRI